jgi:WD40 repeat protein
MRLPVGVTQLAGIGRSGDSARWRVFISHTSELRNFPKGTSYVAAVERAISAAGHVIVDMADFAAADQASARVCAERVRGCDVHVGVLGTRYGSPVRDRHGVSYTELEFDAATDAGLDRLVFVLDIEAEDLGIPASALIDREFGARQDAFRRRVQDSGLSTQLFASPAALGQLVERSLRELADTRQRREQVPAEVVLAARESKAPGAGRRVAPWTRGCPYRGLLPFGEADAEVFYGREQLAAELAVKLAARVSRGGMVVVTGASGSGKSSLLRAGLLPILARGQQIPGSDRWPRIVMTPTKDPLTELAARLAAVGGPDALAVRDGLMRHPDQAHLAIRSAVLAAAARYDEQPPTSGDSGPRLMLIVDQFEQVFTLNPDRDGEAARQAFITALCSAAANPVGPGQVPPALVVIAVRGDFWDQCAAVPGLVSALQDGQFVVGPMTESELRVAITGPAEAAGLRIDPALTDTILGDLRAAGEDRSAGVLPLLSQAMALTWEQREGDRLTSHGYAQAGGVSRAVQTGADRVYGALPAGQQPIAREVLRSMTVASRDGGLARRPVTREDLYAGQPGAARSDIDAVLDAFAAERLTVLDGDRAQLSHDVLLRAWPQLRGWLEEDQASWILYGQLGDAAAAWQDSHHDPSFLYRGAQLTTLRQAVTRWSASPGRYPALTGTQDDFLRASQRAASRGTRRRRSGVAGLALLTVAAILASAFAFQQRSSSLRQRDQAIFNQTNAEAFQISATNPSLAAQLTLAAYRMQPTQDLATQLLSTENLPLSTPLAANSDSSVDSVAISPDGRTLASANIDGTIRLWNVRNSAHPRPLGQLMTDSAGIASLAFSPDGRTLVAAGYPNTSGGAIWLWDVSGPAHPRMLGQPLSPNGQSLSQDDSSDAGAAAFSPDGRILATGGSVSSGISSNPSTIQLWDMNNPARPQPLGRYTTSSMSIQSLAFSPDGRTLVSSELSASFTSTVQLWNVSDATHPHLLGSPAAGNEFASAAFSRDDILATGNKNGGIQLWDAANPVHPRPLGGPIAISSNSSIYFVTFSPDGQTLVTVDSTGTAQMWNVVNPAQPQLLSQPFSGKSNGGINSLAFSPDGRTLITGDNNGIVQLWDIPPAALAGSPGSIIRSLAFSPDGHVLASVDSNGSARLWNAASPAALKPLSQLPTARNQQVSSLIYSPDGRTIAGLESSGQTGSVQLWNVADPATPRPLGHPLTSPNQFGVSSIAFGPDGRTLAIGSSGIIQLWGIGNPEHPQPGPQILTGGDGDPPIAAMAFSLDGRILASIDYGGTIQLWNVIHPHAAQLLGSTNTNTNTNTNIFYNGNQSPLLTYSPNGRVLTLLTAKGTVEIWNVIDPAKPNRLRRLPAITTGSVASVALSSQGTLATDDDDGAIQLWTSANPANPQPFGQPIASNSSITSVTFSPDGTMASGTSAGTIFLWDLHVNDAIKRICATAGDNLTPQNWHYYIPQLPYQAPCHQ